MIFKNTDDFILLINSYTSNIFTDTFMDKYAPFFDWLIADQKIPPVRDNETDIFVEKAAKIFADPDRVSLLCEQTPCNILFSFYYRYHVLAEYVADTSKPFSACTRDGEKLFNELFIFTWACGIDTFSAKNF